MPREVGWRNWSISKEFVGCDNLCKAKKKPIFCHRVERIKCLVVDSSEKSL